MNKINFMDLVNELTKVTKRKALEGYIEVNEPLEYLNNIINELSEDYQDYYFYLTDNTKQSIETVVLEAVGTELEGLEGIVVKRSCNEVVFVGNNAVCNLKLLLNNAYFDNENRFIEGIPDVHKRKIAKWFDSTVDAYKIRMNYLSHFEEPIIELYDSKSNHLGYLYTDKMTIELECSLRFGNFTISKLRTLTADLNQNKTSEFYSYDMPTYDNGKPDKRIRCKTILPYTDIRRDFRVAYEFNEQAMKQLEQLEETI